MSDIKTDRAGERGAVSIFLVIFFALLLGVITISFVSIVIRDTVQSTNNDLSRSAYDSAEAGIEDAKRAIALYANACSAGTGQCATYQGYLDSASCNSLTNFGALGLQVSGNEVKVQSNGDDGFQQAYTCVTVQLNTPDYINKSQEFASDIIPLKSVSDFSTVAVSWFTHTDAGIADGASFTPRASGNQLPPESSWGGNATPALLRLELISYRGTGTINGDDLDSDARTIFLYPSAGSANVTFPGRDATHTAPNPGPTITAADCGANGSEQYACTANVSLGDLGSSAGRTMFLRVTPVYKGTTFRVQLTNGGDPVNFAGVQPIVDSTGRADDLFRRVQARVRLQNTALYPEFAVATQGAFCKDFSVGSSASDFVNNPDCQ